MASDPTLTALSSVDGRYALRTKKLAPYLSESALMEYRLRIETEFLIALSELPGFGPRALTENEIELLRNLPRLTDEQALIVKAIEVTGYKDVKATNHDVKAIEYFMRGELSETSLKDTLEWIHFGLTSEDVNNTSYALMLRDGVEQVLLPALDRIQERLGSFAEAFADASMLARTHGQPASPTTFGKEMAVFHARLAREIKKLENFEISAKLNGATGNFNALAAAAADIDWISFSERFIERLQTPDGKLKLVANLYTTQIEPHDSYAEIFQLLSRVNTILIDLDQDLWRYISDGWISQKMVEGEIGSSTMPHKVNPIDFENSEGNLGIANALFSFFAAKLPISRLQRDLSDSTVERNFGLAFAHALIGYESLIKGFGKIEPSSERMRTVLQEHTEVLAEAIQTILRREGAYDAYEKLLAFTRGKHIELNELHNFVQELSVNDDVKKELLRLTPENYTGLASLLAKREAKENS